MKKLFLLIIAILIAIPCLSQKLPEQVQINYKGSSILLQNHSDFQYPTNNFFLGGHWSEGKFLTKALGMNIIHCEIQECTTNTNNYDTVRNRYNPYLFADSCRMIMRSTWIGGYWEGWNPIDARALHYNPIIKADEFNDTTFDATNGFIGFKYISPTTTVAGKSLVLDKMTTDTGIVLKDNLLADISSKSVS